MKTKNIDLDDIGHIGGGPPPTEKDLRAISAFIKAQKAKRRSARKSASQRTAKRKTEAKARV